MPTPCPAAPPYQRYQPEHTVLYRMTEANLPTFLAHTAVEADRSGLPVFVKREFRAYLQCGILDHGFARVRCAGCT